MTDITEGIREYLLAFADDEHLMGQQHTEWIGVAPFLEEDLAFASIAQDELGHAALLYGIVAGVQPTGPDSVEVDRLAFGRGSEEYRSAQLTELATADWAHALVRHWLYDAAEALRWRLLVDSSLEPVSSAAAHALREERFHLRHADGLVDALMRTGDGLARVDGALSDLLPVALGLFDPVVGEAEAVESRVASAPMDTLLPEWTEGVLARFPHIDLDSVVAPPTTARTGRHPDFEPLMARMRTVLEAFPTASW